MDDESTTLGFPCSQAFLYRYSLIPRGAGAWSPEYLVQRAGRGCAQIQAESKTGGQRRREAPVLILCGRRRLVFFPGGCQRDVLANLDCICQCCVV